jgi:hypothetical protein
MKKSFRSKLRQFLLGTNDGHVEVKGVLVECHIAQLGEACKPLVTATVNSRKPSESNCAHSGPTSESTPLLIPSDRAYAPYQRHHSTPCHGNGGMQ